MIQLLNVSKKYDDIKILENLNLSVDTGTIYGVLGRSGAGKSSLIRMLNGLVKPDSGQILIDNQDLTTLTTLELRKMRKRVSMIFQQFNLLYQQDVLNNVLIGYQGKDLSKIEKQQKAINLLKLVGLEGFENRYPKTLSGGQMQRVAIARALMNEPDYLLCDEITSSLDQETAYQILDLLKQINQQMNLTILFVSHDIDAVKYICSDVCVIEDKHVIESGKTIDLALNHQSSVSKRFLNHFDDRFLDKVTEDVYEVYFLNEINYPLISQVSKKHLVDISILYAKISEINHQSVGYLLITVSGRHKLEAIADLKAKVSVNLYV
ncbi:MAG: methionine ABC transporter ATP-binding protein [Acholeplasmataceae bacterium]